MLSYSIYDGERTVGKALIEQQGMYYLLRCSCRPVSGKPERIALVSSEGTRTDLGWCVPEGRDMTLVKRIRKTDMDEQNARFEIAHKIEPGGIKLEDGMPFEMLEKLPNASVLVDEGELRLVFGSQSNSRPTGQ